jgi:hypothetical protein
MGVMNTRMISTCSETNDCERLYSLDVLGVEDRGDTNSEVLNEFKENISRKEDMRSDFHGFRERACQRQTSCRARNGYNM